VHSRWTLVCGLWSVQLASAADGRRSFGATKLSAFPVFLIATTDFLERGKMTWLGCCVGKILESWEKWESRMRVFGRWTVLGLIEFTVQVESELL
jgi:hypothetical protein